MALLGLQDHRAYKAYKAMLALPDLLERREFKVTLDRQAQQEHKAHKVCRVQQALLEPKVT